MTKRIWYLISMVLLTMGMAAIAYSQTLAPGTNDLTIIDEKNLLLSWGIVVVLLSAAAGISTAFAQNKSHRDNSELHHDSTWLTDRFESKTDCVARHTEISQNVIRIYDRLDEIKTDVAFVRGKLGG